MTFNFFGIHKGKTHTHPTTATINLLSKYHPGRSSTKRDKNINLQLRMTTKFDGK